MTRRIIIIGAGHAGIQAAASLREEGYDGDIHVFDGQPYWPYQRPPLSKTFMKARDNEALPLRGESFFAEAGIVLHRGQAVEAVDMKARTVVAGGQLFAYDHLIFATGSTPRRLSLPGAAPGGVHYLATQDDAIAFRAALEPAEHIAIIGGGFIGLECASIASAAGKTVTVIEAAPRLLARAVSASMAERMTEAYKAFGVRIMTSTAVTALKGAGNVTAIETDKGDISTDCVLVGIGSQPNTGIAEKSGLAYANGIVVNAALLTHNPHISAIGDCACFPDQHSRTPIRLECVQNALDQAKFVAQRLLNKAETYSALPWFWSDQRDMKLQIAGLSLGHEDWLTKQEASGAITYGFRNGRLAVVETLNRPADHMAARRLLTGSAPDRATLERQGFDLRQALKPT